MSIFAQAQSSYLVAVTRFSLARFSLGIAAALFYFGWLNVG